MAERSNAQVFGAIVIAIAIGAAVSWAGSDGGDRVGSVPLFALCGAVAFAINWLIFIPSVLAGTERYYDLVGGLTYITTIIVAVLLSGALDLRATLVAGMVLFWSLRLATFLFRRISKSGGDSRFDDIKHRPLRFFMAWTLQGLWVLLTAAAALAVITGGTREPLGAVGIIGIAIWALGLPSRSSRIDRNPNSKTTRTTTENSSTSACGRGPVTRIISAKSYCGSGWQSSPCPCCRAGSGRR